MMKLHKARRVVVEFDDGESVTLHARRVPWSYGVSWSEAWDDCAPDDDDDEKARHAKSLTRIELCIEALRDHVTGVEGVEDEDGPVDWPDDDDDREELLGALFSPVQIVQVAHHLVYEDSAGKSLRSVSTA